MDLQLHPVTKRQLESCIKDLPQSLLLSGQAGVGLKTIAQCIASKNQAGLIQPKNTKGELDAKAGTISVEVIRELYNQTRTKHTKKQIIVIDDADRMSRGAQAAFLKLLEEPNASTHFILTSHEPNVLLPTIRSRVQHLVIQPLTGAQSNAFIESRKLADNKKKVQVQFIATGLPAEINRLLADSRYFEAKAGIITDARTLLQADTYQKLRVIYNYRTNKEGALELVDSAIAILKYTLITKPQQKLVQQLGQLLEVKEQIAANQSISLNLARIML